MNSWHRSTDTGFQLHCRTLFRVNPPTAFPWSSTFTLIAANRYCCMPYIKTTAL